MMESRRILPSRSSKKIFNKSCGRAFEEERKVGKKEGSSTSTTVA